MDIKAIITTMDNLPNNKEQLVVLLDDPLISEIIFVNQESRDGTQEWLDSVAANHSQVRAIHRQNNGAGPGRNAGLDAAGEFDFVLMLDGGIRPLRGGTRRMLNYLGRTPVVDVIGVEIADFETDRERAWRRWPSPIGEVDTYRNTRLSHTAYCLARRRAFNGLRFCEEGPFGEPGWGADDDEMAYQWNEEGIIVHVVTGVHPYRRGSGSFRRLLRETGVWANQYGSVYERRVVWLQQNWPQYQPGLQWGEPWLTVVVKVGDMEETAKLIKRAHDRLRERKFEKPWDYVPNPYAVVAWCPDPDHPFLDWAEPRRLRQHHGDTIIVDGEIVRRIPENEEAWTGDFRVWTNEDWRGVIRPNAFYYGLVDDLESLGQLLNKYNSLHPTQAGSVPPGERGELWPP